MPRIPPSDDDGPGGPGDPFGAELSEAAKHALARQQKLDDANFIIERTLQFKNEMAAEFERSKRDGDAADPMFEPNIMKFGFEMRSSLLSDIPRGSRGRLISQDAIEKTRSNMESAMERFSTAALHRLNLERHSRAFANIQEAGEEFAKAAGRDARGLQGLLSTVDNLMDRYEGVFADEEIADQRARLRTGTVIAAVNGLIEQGKAGFARELIQKGAFDADLGHEPARLLLGRIDKTERDNAAQAALEAARARVVAVAMLDLRVATGKAFPAELDLALAQGTISPLQHADFLAEIEKQDEDRAKRMGDMARVSDLLGWRQKPDADDPADRAAIDAKFDGLSAAIAERPPEDRALIEDDYVARTGMLPAALRDRLLVGMFSEDPAAQVAAAGRLVAFEDSDPTLTAEFPDDMLARAQAIKAFVYPGLTPARIVQLADERIAQQEAVRAEDEGIKGDEEDSLDLPGESPDSFDDADDGRLSDGEEGDVELDREREDELIRQLRGADALLPQAPREDQTVEQKPDKKTRTLFEQLATEFERARKLGIRRFIPPATRRQFDSLVEALPTGKELEELGIAMTPVAGEMQSAREAIEAFARFGSSVEKGNAGEAATAAAEGIIGLIGVIPLIGTVGRAGKAGGKVVSAGIKRAGNGKAASAAPNAGKLAEKIAPRLKLSRPLKKELKELHLERDRIRALRLEAPPGSKGRAALLKQQRRIQLEINKKVGKAFEKQVLGDLEKQGFRVVRGPRFRTPEGWRRPDAVIVNERGEITHIVEIKSGRARLIKAQESKDKFLAQELGVRKLLIREQPPTKFTSIRRSPKGRR